LLVVAGYFRIEAYRGWLEPSRTEQNDGILLGMDVLKMLAELQAEREQISQAIDTIERLAAGTRGKRRGRPPAWMAAVAAPKRRGRPPGSKNQPKSQEG
jgi:hypothetical protein